MKQSEARAIIEASVTVDENDCWIWSKRPGHRLDGEVRKDRYAKFNLDGRTVYAHRVAYMAYRGAVERGKHVCHRCDVPACVNPEHLFIGTHEENMADMVAKGRSPSRELRNPHGRLTDEQVREIRRKYQRGFPVSWLAAEYGMSKRYLRDVISRRVKNGHPVRYHADAS